MRVGLGDGKLNPLCAYWTDAIKRFDGLGRRGSPAGAEGGATEGGAAAAEDGNAATSSIVWACATAACCRRAAEQGWFDT